MNRRQVTERIALTRRLLADARDADRYDADLAADLRAAAAIIRDTVPDGAAHDDSPVVLWDPRADLL